MPRYGHIQEVIVQNFRAKPDTKRADAAEPDLDDLLWTIAAARLILGPDMNIQAPPNLSPGVYPRLIAAGINDWGGVSPVTPDHVNPEAPWPAIDELARPQRRGRARCWSSACRLSGLCARRRHLAGARGRHAGAAHERRRRPGARRRLGARRDRRRRRRRGVLVREVDPGVGAHRRARRPRASASIQPRDRAPVRGARRRLSAMSPARPTRCASAVSGDVVRYVVNRNINYTNICYFRCQLLRLLQGPHARRPARRALRSRRSTKCRAAPSRPGSAAPPKSACRAASIPTTPARPTSRSAARSRRRCPACTSTPSRRWR